MAPAPRPEQINVALSAEELAAADRAAARAGMSRSEWVRQLMRRASGLPTVADDMEREVLEPLRERMADRHLGDGDE